MRKRIWLILLGILWLPVTVHAFSVRVVVDGKPVRWETVPITYYIQMAGSDDLTPEQSLDAVHKAFESWAELDCTNVVFEELGDAPNPNSVVLAGHAPNGLNELVWIEDETWQLGQYVLGVTGPIINGEGVLVEADIAFNGYLLKWSVTGKGGTDLESVAVHEIGHMMGGQHNIGPYSWKQPPTMAPNISSNNKSRTLEIDDQWLGCFLYPAGGEWSCESQEQCPKILSQNFEGNDFYAGTFTCDLEINRCTDPTILTPGIAGLGEACPYASACAEDLYCQPWNDESVCTFYCEIGADECPEDFVCEAFKQFPSYGACLPSSGTILGPGEGPNGCLSSAVCTDGKVCLPIPDGAKKLCTTICQLDDPSSCPEGKICFDYGTGKETGACFDLDLIPADQLPANPDPEPVEAEFSDASIEPDATDAGTSDDLAEAEPVEADAPGGIADSSAGITGTEDDGCASSGTRPILPMTFLLIFTMLWLCRGRKSVY
jgi:hypothetical protein